MLKLRRALNERGVLGINRRNADYISLHNPRRQYPLVDDKILTKQLAIDAGMAVPELYGIVETQHQIYDVPEMLADRRSFVAKPAHGSGGDGILVITGRREGLYQKSSGRWIDESELEHHLSSAISGLYSLGGRPDRLLLEYCVECDPVFEKISYQGVPDVRVIVFLGYPIMSMLRLPTHQSDGKANLHQGAVGVGIDLVTGVTLGGVQGNSTVDIHPDTAQPIAGVEVPYWGQILEHAARSCQMTGLGYVGVDIVLDRDHGPLILELNARPGLNIQIANRKGLRKRLEWVRDEAPRDAGLEERLGLMRERFG